MSRGSVRKSGKYFMNILISLNNDHEDSKKIKFFDKLYRIFWFSGMQCSIWGIKDFLWALLKYHTPWLWMVWVDWITLSPAVSLISVIRSPVWRDEGYGVCCCHGRRSQSRLVISQANTTRSNSRQTDHRWISHWVHCYCWWCLGSGPPDPSHYCSILDCFSPCESVGQHWLLIAKGQFPSRTGDSIIPGMREANSNQHFMTTLI